MAAPHYDGDDLGNALGKTLVLTGALTLGGVPHSAWPAGAGDIVGPASATDGHLVVFDGTSGKLAKDGGATTAYATAAQGAKADTAIQPAGLLQVPNEQTDDYTLVLADATATLVVMNKGTAVVLTIPPNASVAFAVGTVIPVAQKGAGQVTLTAGAGVTLTATPGLKMSAQYAIAGVVKLATNTWYAFGSLSA